jgi:hypothetical protein
VYVLYLPQLHFNATQGKILQYFIKAEKEVFPTTPPGVAFNKLALIYSGSSVYPQGGFSFWTFTVMQQSINRHTYINGKINNGRVLVSLSFQYLGK